MILGNEPSFWRRYHGNFWDSDECSIIIIKMARGEKKLSSERGTETNKKRYFVFGICTRSSNENNGKEPFFFLATLTVILQFRRFLSVFFLFSVLLQRNVWFRKKNCKIIAFPLAQEINLNFWESAEPESLVSRKENLYWNWKKGCCRHLLADKVSWVATWLWMKSQFVMQARFYSLGWLLFSIKTWLPL